MEIGEIVRRYRIGRGILQADFAADVGVTGSMLSAIELGRSRMTPAQIARLRAAHPELWESVARMKLAETAREVGLDPEQLPAHLAEPDLEDLVAVQELVSRIIAKRRRKDDDDGR